MNGSFHPWDDGKKQRSEGETKELAEIEALALG